MAMMKIIANSGLMCDECGCIKTILMEFSDDAVETFRTLICEGCLETAKNELAGYRKFLRRRKKSDEAKME